MDVHLLHVVDLSVRVVDSLDSGEDFESGAWSTRGYHRDAVGRREDDLASDYGTATEEAALFGADADLEGKVLDVG